ncbi:Wzz/FepE/Etk N-terminal domain-containing protein [Pseudomonadales bacterium]|nr:Wzz/FepE/Etk N-terminal domain-containing protein [Pseudomonadales bacterium]
MTTDKTENTLPVGTPMQPVYLVQANNRKTDDEIDLRELWNALWQGKVTIIAITSVFAIASVIIALMLPNIYRSEALLAPAEESQGGGLSALAGQFGGLASIAGINLSDGATDPTVVAIETLKSRRFVKTFIDKHKLLVPLMASDGWNESDNTLNIDDGIYNSATQEWVRDVSPPLQAKPSDMEAYNVFMEDVLSVSQDKKSSLVRIGVEFYSPTLAKQWVDWLVTDLNDYMRAKDLTSANRTIDYLTKQLNSTSIADMQTIFYQLIEEQTKIIMLANVRQDYVLEVIDPAVVPEKKVEPKRALICVLITIAGGSFSIVIVLFRHFKGKEKSVLFD